MMSYHVLLYGVACSVYADRVMSMQNQPKGPLQYEQNTSSRTPRAPDIWSPRGREPQLEETSACRYHFDPSTTERKRLAHPVSFPQGGPGRFRAPGMLRSIQSSCSSSFLGCLGLRPSVEKRACNIDSDARIDAECAEHCGDSKGLFGG